MSEELRPAATIILVRDKHNEVEVLLLQRSINAGFLPEHWVFPGGAVDPEDLPGGNETQRACVAAGREANEEAGVTLDQDTFIPFSHWTAPIKFPRRFATWFFIAPFNQNSSIKIDNLEIQDHQWVNPARAIEMHYQGKLAIMPPTFKTLIEIQSAKSTKELIERCEQQLPFKYFPKIVKYKDQHVYLYNNDSGYKNADIENTDILDRITVEKGIISYHKSD